jgi:membrane protease YdiL (CAAX protease family)
LIETPQPRIWTLFVTTAVLAFGAFVLSSYILQGYVILSSRAVLAGGPVSLDRLDAFYRTLPGVLLMATLSASWIGIVALAAGMLSTTPVVSRLGLEPTRPSPWVWLLVPAGGLAVNQAVDAAFSLVGGGRGALLDDLVKVLATARGPGLALAVLVVGVLSATCEELFFRGYLQRRLVARLGPALGIAIPAFLFGLAHWDLHHSTFAFLFGLWLGYAAWATGSTWVAIVGHVVNNTVSVVSIAFGAQDASRPSAMHAAVLLASLAAVAGIALWMARLTRRAAVSKLPAWSSMD